MDEMKGCLGAILLLALAFGTCFLCYKAGADSIRDDAIERGVAEWRCDPETGALSFTWNE